VSSTEPITAELTELGQAGVIGVRQDDGRVAPPYAVYGGGDLRGLPLAKLQPTTVGDDLYRLMRLNEVATVDLADVFAEMGGDPALMPSG
jgi:hypothetical protein